MHDRNDDIIIDLGDAVAQTKGNGGFDVDTNQQPKPILGLGDD